MSAGAGHERRAPGEPAAESVVEVEPSPVWSGEVALPSTGPDAVSFLAVLRIHDFRLLWAAQAAAQLGDKFLVFSLLIVVFGLTGRSSTLSLVMLSYTLPSILLSAPAGVFADRHDKRTLMLVTNVVRGGLVLLIPLTLSLPVLSGQAWPLLTVTVLFSAVGQLFAPAEAASIPVLVSRDQIMVATSLFMTTVIGTLVAGVPLATVCIKVLGDKSAFYVAAGLFGVGAVCILAMHRHSLRTRPHAGRQTDSVMRELRDGLAVLAGARQLRVGLLQLTVSLVVVTTMFALGPAYVHSVLGRPPEDTYQLLIPATGGLVFTAIALGRTGGRLSRARAVVMASMLCGLILVATGVVPGWVVRSGHGGWLTPLVLVMGVAFGCGIGALLIVAFTVVQEGTDEATRGRIFGGIFAVINAATAVPLLLAGGLADAVGVDWVVGGLGAVLVLYGALAGTLGRSRLQLLDPLPAPAPLGG